MAGHPELNERDRQILGAVVAAYIEQREPISSLWLAKGRIGVSSATLRNVLARLEEQACASRTPLPGASPRIRGYRSYVDQVLADRRAPRAAPTVEARLRRASSVEDLPVSCIARDFPGLASRQGSRSGRRRSGVARARISCRSTAGRSSSSSWPGRPRVAQGHHAERTVRPGRAARSDQLPQ